jgi:hypothetical protein
MPNEAHRLGMPENEVVKYYLKLTEEEKKAERRRMRKAEVHTG